MTEVKRYSLKGIATPGALRIAGVPDEVVDASDFDALAERLSIMVECADNYSRMFEEVSDELAKARELLRCLLMLHQDAVWVNEPWESTFNEVSEWLERNQ